MNFVSLFAGVGGFDLAFERAGMDCVGQVEIDAKCREVLHKHWPHVPKWSDIKEVDGGWLGPVDVLTGGFPCQDYSVAGLRGGLVGDRGALWWQFHRLIAECRPRWVVGENVPGLLSSNNGRDFGAIVGSLVELGYGVVWRVLDAQYFGVAQRRRRVFIVGHFGGIPRPEILAFAEGCTGDTPPRRQEGERVAPTLESGANSTGGTRPPSSTVDTATSLIPMLAPTIGSRSTAGGGLGTDFDLNGGLVPQTVGALRTRDWKGPPIDIAEPSLIVASTLTAAPNGNGRRQEDDHNIVAIDWTQSGAVAQLEMSPTLRRGSTLETLSAPPAVHTRAGVRRLTPLECERLQGFPDNWTASQSDTQRYRQMGNAVAVPVAEWIGKQLVKAE